MKRIIAVLVITLFLGSIVSGVQESKPKPKEKVPHVVNDVPKKDIQEKQQGFWPSLKSASNLFDELHQLPEENKLKIEKLKTEIYALRMRMLDEEAILLNLINKKNQLKNTWNWFFNSTARASVDQIQLQINDQIRVIDNTSDDIQVHWRLIKPLYGLYSKLFLNDMFGFIPLLVATFSEFLSTLLIMDLLSLIMFGPIALFFISFWFTLGIRSFLYIWSAIALIIAIYWTFQLPSIIIQYNPSIWEFLAIYIPVVGMSFLITLVLANYLYGTARRPARHTNHKERMKKE